LTLSQVFAQQIPQTFQGKHHMMSKDELKMMHTIARDFEETPPPEGTVRNIAEFERMQGVIVTFLSYGSNGYFGIPVDLIKEMAEDVMVYTVVEDQSAENFVTSLYEEGSVNLNNIKFVKSYADSYWSRDYSPWFITNNNKPAIVDFPYNRPRPNDDDMPIVFGEYLNIDVYGMDLISTGGNYMSDGMKVAASCDLVYTENPTKDSLEVAELAKNYLGIDKYHLVRDPLDDYIEHIDCWGKFLAVDKILIGKVPESDDRYDDFEAMAAYWANQTTSFGNKYKVYRTYSPNGQPYTNSLILNSKVLVPIVEGYGSQWNDSALNVYRKAMPGYEVIGFTPSSAGWQSTDALHCRTHELPDMEMLHIYHKAQKDKIIIDSIDNNLVANAVSFNDYEITTVDLAYSINNNAFTQVSMTVLNAEDGKYGFTLPELSVGDTLAYYIEAHDKSGRVEKHPFMGEADPHVLLPVKTSSIQEKSAGNAFSIYPNPAKNKIYISGNKCLEEDITLTITDMFGKVVYTTGNNIVLTQSIDVSFLTKGAYVVNIKNGMESYSQRFIKL
jgi:agmatine/peptidylarginine deiminase